MIFFDVLMIAVRDQAYVFEGGRGNCIYMNSVSKHIRSHSTELDTTESLKIE
jgi:hypothetical protein